VKTTTRFFPRSRGNTKKTFAELPLLLATLNDLKVCLLRSTRPKSGPSTLKVYAPYARGKVFATVALTHLLKITSGHSRHLPRVTDTVGVACCGPTNDFQQRHPDSSDRRIGQIKPRNGLTGSDEVVRVNHGRPPYHIPALLGTPEQTEAYRDPHVRRKRIQASLSA
jgi:hypothetical protein